MKIISIFSLVLVLTGCVGLAVGSYGTFEDHKESFAISEIKNEFDYQAEYPKLSKAELVSTWGKPDDVSTDGNCEVVTYHDGYSWSGVGAFLLFFPLPVLVPTGHDESRFYFVNGESVGVVTEYGEVTAGLGYMCGSNECSFLAGSVNTDKARRVKVDWCE